MKDMRHLGAKIKNIRLNKGLSIEQVSNKLRCDFWEYRAIEEGLVIIPFSQLEEISDALQTAPSAFFEPLTHEEYIEMVLGLNKEQLNNSENLLDALLDYAEKVCDIKLLYLKSKEENKTSKIPLTVRSFNDIIDDDEGGLAF